MATQKKVRESGQQQLRRRLLEEMEWDKLRFEILGYLDKYGKDIPFTCEDGVDTKAKRA